jgi:hypothetical protein
MTEHFYVPDYYGRERNREAMSAILSAPKERERLICVTDTVSNTEGETSTTLETPSSSPVLLYVREGRRLLDLREGSRLPAGLQSGVESERKA